MPPPSQINSSAAILKQQYLLIKINNIVNSSCNNIPVSALLFTTRFSVVVFFFFSSFDYIEIVRAHVRGDNPLVVRNYFIGKQQTPFENNKIQKQNKKSDLVIQYAIVLSS